MSYRHTLEAAIESLHEVEDMIAGFPADGNIPSVELDLALQKLRNLYELFLMMRKLPEAVPQAAPKDIPIKETTPSPDTSAKTMEPVIPEMAHFNAGPVIIPVQKEIKEPQVLSDRFKGRSTLHESLHHSMTNDGNTLSQAKPIQHLMTAIGINDRFTFMRELFNNDTNAFENTLRILDEAANFNDAYNYMIQYFDWDMDSDAVQLLLEIIRRKFITGKHE
jgi:hypothetical protein